MWLKLMARVTAERDAAEARFTEWSGTDVPALNIALTRAREDAADAERRAAQAAQDLRAYGQHRDGCAADACRICSQHPDSAEFGGCLRGGRLPDGACSNDKHGTHDFDPLPCTCGFAKALLLASRSTTRLR